MKRFHLSQRRKSHCHADRSLTADSGNFPLSERRSETCSPGPAELGLGSHLKLDWGRMVPKIVCLLAGFSSMWTVDWVLKFLVAVYWSLSSVS